MRDKQGHFIAGHKVTSDMKEKMKLAKLKNPTKYWLGKKLPEQTLKALDRTGKPGWNKGKKLGFIPKMAFGYGQIMKGETHYNWKGGITPVNKVIRHSLKYIDWRTEVFERDNYTCQSCGARGIEVQADHIKPFAFYSELRFETSNGRTLCISCHELTPTYKKRKETYVTAFV